MTNSSLLDLNVMLPDRCRGCSAHRAVVAPGKGPHPAAYVCVCCDTHRGWMSRTTYDFLITFIKVFGRPDQPISVSRKSQECRDSGADPVQSDVGNFPTLQLQPPSKG